MKNLDIVIRSDLQQAFPTLIEGLRKAQNVFDSIKSFKDIERIFLLGSGLSPNTYRNYLTAIKQFYEFTGGLNPLQVRPGDIEAFYDDIVKRVDRNTACLRIRGLKKFFVGIRQVIPIYTSPFELMEPKLTEKLNKTRKGNRKRKALSKGEIKGLLAWLQKDTTVTGLENYALTYMLVTSGLRAAELIQLHWKDLEYFEGTWTACFIGKGDKPAEQELYTPAVEACREYFIRHHGRDPQPADNLFYTYPDGPKKPKPLPYHSLWNRISEIGKKAREEEVIKRDLQFSPHLFRRSYATLLYKAGMKLVAIQGKTRHANVEVLVKHYIHDDEPASPYFAAVLA